MRFENKNSLDRNKKKKKVFVPFSRSALTQQMVTGKVGRSAHFQPLSRANPHLWVSVWASCVQRQRGRALVEAFGGAAGRLVGCGRRSPSQNPAGLNEPTQKRCSPECRLGLSSKVLDKGHGWIASLWPRIQPPTIDRPACTSGGN